MKNRPSTYITKVNNRRSFAQNASLYEKSMAELKEIYWFEKELLIAIPILMRSANTFELVEILTVQSKYLKEHLLKLERKFPNIHKITLPQISGS